MQASASGRQTALGAAAGGKWLGHGPSPTGHLGASWRRHEIFLTRGHYTEFISFRIGHNNPRCAALTDVDSACPDADEPLDLRLLVVWHPNHGGAGSYAAWAREPR